MKTLIVLRHAKAEAYSDDGSDIARPLAERGKRDAGRAGKSLRKLELTPDRILLSPSTRTRETVAALIEKLRHEPPMEIEEGIYEASWQSLHAIVSRQSEGERILLVGHNPGVEDLISHLIGVDGANRITLPTCGMARIDFEIESWDKLDGAGGQLVWLTNPEMLRDVS